MKKLSPGKYTIEIIPKDLEVNKPDWAGEIKWKILKGIPKDTDWNNKENICKPKETTTQSAWANFEGWKNNKYTTFTI